MTKTFRSLVAAAAATAALSLITLASASPSAAASPAVPHSAAGQFENNNWAGTMVKAKGSGGFHVVSAKFTVPKVNCARSVKTSKTLPGDAYSEASFWVGLGGWLHTKALEQAGITAICATKTSAAHYQAWYEMVPANDQTVSIRLTTHETYPGAYGSTPGKTKPVRAGDSISVIVQDNSNAMAESGRIYEVDFYDWTQAAGYQSLGNLSPGIRGNDQTAEVITERTAHTVANPVLLGLAYHGSVYYTDTMVSTFADPGHTFGLSARPSFTSTRLVMTDENGRFLIIPTALSGYGGTYGPGGHSFHTFWVAS
jgi:hypothetical protein